MNKVDIDYILQQAVKLPKSLKSVLDDTEKLYKDETIVPTREPKPKRRKQDIRTRRRNQREHAAKRSEEAADERRKADGSLRDQFYKLRREVLRRKNGKVQREKNGCWDWELTLEQWIWMWLSCPLIDLGNGIKVSSNSLRGRNPKEHVQLQRLNAKESFNINNLVIKHGRKILYIPKEDLMKTE